jgi:hypothetical protein
VVTHHHLVGTLGWITKLATKTTAEAADLNVTLRHSEVLLKMAALQNAIWNRASFSGRATDATGVIQIFSIGVERMLGYAAADVIGKITPAELSDPPSFPIRPRRSKSTT